MNTPSDNLAILGELMGRLAECLRDLVAALRREQPACPVRRALARLLETWRLDLVEHPQLALAPVRLCMGFTALYALCDVTLKSMGGAEGIHIEGDATAALDAAMRLGHFCDRARGTAVGEEVMAALLSSVVRSDLGDVASAACH